MRPDDRHDNQHSPSGGQEPTVVALMALAWILRHDSVTSVLIGASKVAQIDDAAGMLENRHFSAEELARIEAILSSSK